MSMTFVNSGDVTTLFPFSEIGMCRVAYVQIISGSQHSVGFQILNHLHIAAVYQSVCGRIPLRRRQHGIGRGRRKIPAGCIRQSEGAVTRYVVERHGIDEHLHIVVELRAVESHSNF